LVGYITDDDGSTTSVATCQADQFSDSEVLACPNGWVGDTKLFSSTATIDLGMVCQDQWKKSFAQSLYMAGMLVGSFLFGTMADWKGRRPTLAISCLFLAVSGTVCATLPASANMFPAFATLRFLAGMGHVGTFMMAFQLAVEYTGREKQALTGCLIEIPFASGGLLVGILSWAGIRNWRWLMGILSAPAALLSLLYFIIPESPRWLLAKGKIEELERDVKKTAKINKTFYPSDIFDAKHEIQENKDCVGKATLRDLFRPMTICGRTLVMFYNWLVTTMCFYGLTMVASDIGDNVFLNFSLVLGIELPAILFATYGLDKFGRKPLLAYSQILAGVTLIAAGLLINYDPLIPTILSLIGKFGSTSSFAIVFVYTAEMFPTEIRSSAVGSSSTCARVGGILAPQVANLAVYWITLPFYLMGASSLVGGIMILINLPETLGEPLPETMAEALNLGKKGNKAKEIPEDATNLDCT